MEKDLFISLLSNFLFLKLFALVFVYFFDSSGLKMHYTNIMREVILCLDYLVRNFILSFCGGLGGLV